MTASVVAGQESATLATLVLDVFGTLDQIGNAAGQEQTEEDDGPDAVRNPKSATFYTNSELVRTPGGGRALGKPRTESCCLSDTRPLSRLAGGSWGSRPAPGSFANFPTGWLSGIGWAGTREAVVAEACPATAAAAAAAEAAGRRSRLSLDRETRRGG